MSGLFIGQEYTENLEKQNNEMQEGDQEDLNNEPDTEMEKELNDIMETEYDTEWIEVKNIRRYKATIAAANVPEDTFAKKINNINQKIGHLEDFMGCRIIYVQNKAHVSATFRRKEAMATACEIKLFDDNDFTLIPIQNRGDPEIQEKTVVIRDLPLDVDKFTLKTIMDKLGKVENIKLQISGI
jgi:hypothetical protein